jgi:hypothetical protein
MLNAMACAEQKKLQDRRTAAWSEFEAKLRGTGANFNFRTLGWVRDATGALSLSPAVVRLRWEHLKASNALSKHLSWHRC